ncbi:glutamyl-tRNA reductase [Aliiglaciecola sp. CAU 1673]|uniref:glutamyl-tRNA reductase n=1 Tax=Aliiglaciecola sp. CAU 1673 TaxID=3032595 RepID=UPI0023DB52BB|nr:glutamyl-tRNA reductase [Aliiglaciecola sp. CAU 1673]MDF2179388.1 glutamyl-tRNA reductase [Aliiglaciecola sp. CAU 1673]
MALIAFGINHNTAPVEVREKVAFTPDNVMDALLSIRQELQANESVILSTCNRTEIYADLDDAQVAGLRAWIAGFHGIEHPVLEKSSYFHAQQDAVKHLMRVACGLDSMVLGEPQILGQVKQAYTQAKDSGAVGANFERLFQHTFAIAKKVRTQTDIGANAVSVAFASVQLAKHIFSSLEKVKVLLIGAGETIELVARHLSEQGVSQMMVANRTLARANELAEPLGAQVMTLSQIPEHLAQADVVISSTASQLPILGKGVVETALKQRRHQPMFLVDLAVPRDIEAEVAELDDAYLYTVDDLQEIVQQNLASRQTAAEAAELIVDAGVVEFTQWQEARGAIDLVRQYREQSESFKAKLHEKALKQLAEGRPAEQVVTELANKLTSNLIHAPTQAIRRAALDQDENLLNLLQQVFGLSQDKT